MKSVVFIAILVIYTGLLSQAQQTNSHADAKPTMHKLFKAIQDLLPYSLSEEKFTDPKNVSFIQKKLKELSEISDKIDHTSLVKSPTFKASRQALKTHFSEIERIYRIGNRNYARWQLNSTVPLCMSCHTQIPTESRRWDLSNITTGSYNDYEKAELLFMGRDFDSALKYYDLVIRDFPQNKIQVQYVEKSLERQLVIYSRVKRNFDKGIESLQVDAKNKNLPEYLQKNIKAWIALFRIQKRDGYPDPTKRDDAKIKKYAEKILNRNLWDDMVDANNPRLVKVLTLSGVLYEYLNNFPETPLKPEILRWLAECDRSLQETLFYSLSDLYLKECMENFSDTPVAKKCFEDYKESLTFSYSGSSGTHLPDDVKKELEDWHKKIFKNLNKK